MNFFQKQSQARADTHRLVFLFVLAVMAIVVVTSGSIYVFVRFLLLEGQVALNPWPIVLISAVVTILLVTLRSLYRVTALSRGGGRAVAAMAGARMIVQPQTHEERVLKNVVEEMSLASGVPVPLTYVIDSESSINAFAAGTTIQDAVVCVTHGTMTQLNRDQLQGVVAHEFSHIFNGDMRLNIRLMGLLDGILFIGSIGMELVRMVSQPRSRTRRSQKNDGTIAFVVLGLALAAIGYIGVFFGRLIKSGVSRKREYLADASSVQYTRNPQGLLGAFVKMSQSQSSLTESTKAEELSHMFFGPGLKSLMSGLFATHPPLYDRVAAIDVQFAKQNRDLFKSGSSPGSADQALSQLHAISSSAAAVIPSESLGSSKRINLENLASPQVAGFGRAQKLAENFKGPLLNAARSTQDAPALVMALLMGAGSEFEAQKIWLQQMSASLNVRKVLELKLLIDQGAPDYRLSLLEISAPQLRTMTPQARQMFFKQASDLAGLDARISAREAALLASLKGVLVAPRVQFRVRHKNVREGARDVLSLLWLFASGTTSNAASCLESFNFGVQTVYGPATKPLQKGRDVTDYSELEMRIENLRGAEPQVKAAICEGLLAMAQRDGQMHVSEWELLKAVMSALAVPMPRGVGSQFLMANS